MIVVDSSRGYYDYYNCIALGGHLWDNTGRDRDNTFPKGK